MPESSKGQYNALGGVRLAYAACIVKRFRKALPCASPRMSVGTIVPQTPVGLTAGAWV